jgi:hypothetical protein
MVSTHTEVALCKTSMNRIMKRENTLSKRQETTNKHLERAFIVLQTHWAIVQNPGKQWKFEALDNIITS